MVQLIRHIFTVRILVYIVSNMAKLYKTIYIDILMNWQDNRFIHSLHLCLYGDTISNVVNNNIFI